MGESIAFHPKKGQNEFKNYSKEWTFGTEDMMLLAAGVGE